MEDEEYYVYKWYNVETNYIFYIGKGKNKRMENTSKRNRFFKRYIGAYECACTKIYEHLTEKEALELEHKTILEF